MKHFSHCLVILAIIITAMFIGCTGEEGTLPTGTVSPPDTPKATDKEIVDKTKLDDVEGGVVGEVIPSPSGTDGDSDEVASLSSARVASASIGFGEDTGQGPTSLCSDTSFGENGVAVGIGAIVFKENGVAIKGIYKIRAICKSLNSSGVVGGDSEESERFAGYDPVLPPSAPHAMVYISKTCPADKVLTGLCLRHLNSELNNRVMSVGGICSTVTSGGISADGEKISIGDTELWTYSEAKCINGIVSGFYAQAKFSDWDIYPKTKRLGIFCTEYK